MQSYWQQQLLHMCGPILWDWQHTVSQIIIRPMGSNWQQLLLHMHGPILGDQQCISDNYWAYAKLLAAAAAVYVQAHPKGLAAYLR